MPCGLSLYGIFINSWAAHLAFTFIFVFVLLSILFFLTPAIVWSFSYFLINFYILFVLSIALYALSTVKEISATSKFNKTATFSYINGLDLHYLLLSFFLSSLFVMSAWTHQSTLAWFGNLIFTGFQVKFAFILIIFFYAYIISTVSTLYVVTREANEYLIVCFNFFTWIFFLFESNSIFTVVFFIEVLSSLVLLLLISGSFSTTHYYNNLNLNSLSYAAPNGPFFFFQSVLFFFWISLVSSLNLFLFLILFFLKFLTYDWFLIEFIFFFISSISSIKDIFTLGFVWLNFLFCIFLKCGLVPFYFWKPTFFKGLPIHVLFFYVFFFYFSIFLFFCLFLLNYLNQIFFSFILINILLLFFGIFIIFSILSEAYYLKAFIAMSSILNSLFVFLAASGANFVYFMF